MISFRLVAALTLTTLAAPCKGQTPDARATQGESVTVSESETASPLQDSLRIDPPPRPLIVVSSGGISAGAYQAGVNWAILDLLRRARRGDADAPPPDLPPYELVVAAGASAGNVNSILATLEWARPPDEAPPAASQYWQVWTGIGIEELLPENRDIRGLPSDSLDRDVESVLSRRQMRDVVFARVVEALSDDRLNLNRPVATGITMTSVLPQPRTLVEGLDVDDQRMATVYGVAPAQTTPGAGGPLAFEPFQFSESLVDSAQALASQTGADRFRAFGQLVHPPFEAVATREGRRAHLCESPAPQSVDTQALRRNQALSVNITLASAAFPYAWAPVSVPHATEVDHELFPDLSKASLRTLRFIDGGVFDNNPLGLALELYRHVEVTRPRCSATAPDLAWQRPTVLFTDPDNVRRPPALDGVPLQAANDSILGLAGVLNLASTFVSTGRQYELETTTRTLNLDRYHLTSTTRAYPIVGTQLGAFAAFLARPFRVFDFYVGVYDGYVHAARRLARSTPAARSDERDAIAHLAAASRLVARDPHAALVVRRLLADEYCPDAAPACLDAVNAVLPTPTPQDDWASLLGSMVEVAIRHRNEETAYAQCVASEADTVDKSESKTHEKCKEPDSWFDALVKHLRADDQTMATLRSWEAECRRLKAEGGPNFQPGLECQAAPHVTDLLENQEWWTYGATAEQLNYRAEYESTPTWKTTSALALVGLSLHMADTRPGLAWSASAVPRYADGIYGARSYRKGNRAGRFLARTVVPHVGVVSAGPRYLAWQPSYTTTWGGRFFSTLAPIRQDRVAFGETSQPQWGGSASLGLEVRFRPFVSVYTSAVGRQNFQSTSGRGLSFTAGVRLGHILSLGAEWAPVSTSWENDGETVSYSSDVFLTIGFHDLGGIAYWTYRLLR